MLRQLLKINLRVIIFTLILLIAFDLLLKYVILPRQLNPQVAKAGPSASLPVPAIKRLPADDKDTLALWKRQLTQDQGYKIVFLGDSVVHGGGVPEENQTIAAYLSRELSILLPNKTIKVYNFSLPGCTPADTYNIFRYLADADPDLIIYDINIGWFGSAKFEEHPRLKELVSAGHPLTPAAKQEEKPSLESRLTDFIGTHWTLYQNRIYLNYLWFGSPLKEQLKIGGKPAADTATNELPNQTEEDKYKPWYEKNFDAMKEVQGKLGYVQLDERNQHWVMYQKLIATIKEQQVQAVFFMVPRNEVLYKKYALLDKPVLQARQQQLGDVAVKDGFKVYDYTYLVPDRWFVDSVHMTREGNEQVAKKLARDLIEAKVIH